MKKWLALLLAAMMALALVACGDTPANNDNDNKDNDTKIEEFARGSWDGNVYTNDSLNLTVTVPDGWKIATDEELAAIMGITIDSLTEQGVSEEFLKAQNTYEMMAQDPTNGSNVIVMAENLTVSVGGIGNVAGIIASPALLIHISGKLPFDADRPAKIVIRLLHHIIDHRIEHGAAHACQIQFAGLRLRKRLRCRLRRWERRRLSCRQRRFRRERRRRLLRCRRSRRAAGRKRAERYDDQQYAESFFHFLTPPTTVPTSQDRAKAMI